MANVLMLASFGLEIVECGGALAKAVQHGDTVHAAVLLSRPESQPQIREAAAMLGIAGVEFLGFGYGEVVVTPEAKAPVVELIRRTKPDIAIMQDPEHAQVWEPRELGDDNVRLGLALHRQFDRALALHHGLAGHSGAVLGEAYRREGGFVLERLTK